MKFSNFSTAVYDKFNELTKHQLYTVDIAPDEMWQTYLHSFPVGTDPIYLERTTHDCTCCKNFIRDIGNVVAIIDGKMHSIWEIIAEDEYDVVSRALRDKVLGSTITNVYLKSKKYGNKTGAKQSIQVVDGAENIVWDHFYATVLSSYMSDKRETKLGKTKSAYDVFKRGMEELTIESIETVADLIAQGSLYKGDEFASKISAYHRLKHHYTTAEDKEVFLWENIKQPSAQLRNSAIGTLLIDLSKGEELDRAVTKFELIVAPTNYKRPKALITQGMIDKAMIRIAELGIEDSLHRRLAVLEDISINNKLWVDRSIAPKMKDSLADLLVDAKKPSTKSFDKVEEMHIDKFITEVLPNIDSMEIELAAKLQGNLVSLVAPMHESSPNILNWDNNFTWSYIGNLTDSDMKANVKAAGGKVDGILRCSIQWNEQGSDRANDLDLHCKVSTGQHIYFSNKAGRLDVDITNPGTKTAVENITWPTMNDLQDGTYKFFTHNYAGSNSKGFRAEVEIQGIIHSFDYPTSVRSDVPIATVQVKNGEITLVESMGGTTRKAPPVPVWNITTNTFHKVSIVSLSPNYWDNNKSGNKHFFFFIDQCKNPDPVRGLYNEYLASHLHDDRKVFDALADRLKCPDSDSQISGLGFSSTVRNEVVVKVKGNFTRTLKIKF